MKAFITIKQAREILRIKQEYISCKLNLHQSNYSKMENGQRRFSERHCELIAEIFNIKLEFIKKNEIPIFISFEEME